MKLRGIGIDAMPYIPLAEKDSTIPTVFWLKPKTVGMLQKVFKYEELSNFPNFSKYITDERKLEFLALCTKVENFEFSDENPDLNKLGLIKEITDTPLLALLLNELNPTIFNEVMDEVDNWSMLASNQRKCFELMTYFALVKNEDMSIQERLSYDCSTCQVMKKYEERQCYYLNDANNINLPVLGEQDDFTGEYNVFPITEEKFLSSPEFLEYFFEISSKLYPTVPAYLALQRLHSGMGWEKEVCITGLIDVDYIKVLDWAIDCKNMSSLPYPGEYFAQPNQLMEAFQVVHTAISEYERIKITTKTKTSRAPQNPDGR